MDLPTPPLQEVTAISRPIDDIAADMKEVDYQVRNRPHLDTYLAYRHRKVATTARLLPGGLQQSLTTGDYLSSHGPHRSDLPCVPGRVHSSCAALLHRG